MVRQMNIKFLNKNVLSEVRRNIVDERSDHQDTSNSDKFRNNSPIHPLVAIFINVPLAWRD